MIPSYLLDQHNTVQFELALHMKEHPDYKYRPRRKPKTLQKNSLQQQNSLGKSMLDVGGGVSESHLPAVSHHHALGQSAHNHMDAAAHHAAAAIAAHHNHHQHAVAVAAAAAATQQQQQQQQQQYQQHSRSLKVNMKYGFGTSLETLAMKMPMHACVPSTPFATLPHYPLDPTIALDLQTRLQAMYAGSFYHPWRYFGCTSLMSPEIPTVNATPLTTTTPHSPPSPPSSSGTASISTTPTLLPLTVAPSTASAQSQVANNII